MDFPSFPTLFKTARNEALARNPSLTQDAIDRDGSDANIMVAAACAAADQVVGELVTATAGLFIDSATGDALDKLLFDRYGLIRKQAAGASGTVAFTTSTPAAGVFIIPAQTQLSTATGIKFATVRAVTYPAGSTGPVTVEVSSLLAGHDQQAAENTIVSITGQFLGMPSDLHVTNPQATAGAMDAESDGDFRERGRAFYTTARRGTLSALEQGALATPGVKSATAFELLDSYGRPNYVVSLVVADEYTDALANLSVNPPTYQTQSQQLARTVFNALQEYRPAGVFVQVSVAQVQLQQIRLGLSFAAGVNIDDVANNARATIVGYVNNLAPGDDVKPSEMLQVLRGVSGLVIPPGAVPSSVIMTPIADVVLEPLQVARTTLALVQAYSMNPGTPLGTL